MFEVSACVWCLKGKASDSLGFLRSAGFDYVDVRPDCWDGIRDREHLDSFGVKVACAGITPITMVEGLSLDSLATPDAGRAIPYFTGALRRAAALGARWAYMVTPGNRQAGESRDYSRSMARLAEESSKLGIKLCVEPHPGRALSSYSEVIRFLDMAAAPNLYALVDLGHIPLFGEDVVEVVRSLGDRIGYVHIDDNNGKSDSHFGLMEGKLPARSLYRFFDALAGGPYRGPVAIELSSVLPSPVSSLVSSREFIRHWAESRSHVDPVLR